MNIQATEIVPAEAPASTSTELVIFDQKFTAVALFSPGTMDPLIDRIRQQVKAEAKDPTTPAGRQRIISLAMKVTRTKTAIDAARKQLVSDEKRRLSAIDAEGRRVWNELESLAAEVRQPVTEFENREKDRIEAHKNAVETIRRMADFEAQPTMADLETRLAQVEAVCVDHEEFTSLARSARDAVRESLTQMLARETKAEAERKELERLRKEAAEREQREREERAAAKARAEAEEAARRREEEARRAAEAERLRIQREAEEREAKIRAEAEAKERAAREAAERAEREKAEAEAAAKRAEEARIAAEKKAEQDRIEAQRRAEEARKSAEEDARRREREAVEAERRRLEEEQRQRDEEARRRERDKAHRAKVNNEAAAALVIGADISADVAKRVVVAIAKGQVPHISIAY
jgi:hypothetical protein